MARSGIRNKLGRHARLFIVASGLFLIAAPVRVLAQPTLYAANCRVQIQAIGPGGAGGTVGDDPKKNPTETVGSFKSMIEVIQSPAMAARVAMDLKVPVERVLGKINASLVTGTQVLAFTTVDADAAFAAQRCNAFGRAFLQYRLDGARKQISTTLLAQKARWSQLKRQLDELDRKTRTGSKAQADDLHYQRLHIVSNVSDVEEEIANLEAAVGLGLASAGSIISPAGSTGSPVGPNRAFPIGLMAGGIAALAITAMIPRRPVKDVAPAKTY
jgi:capsular polysaccharide biosynthesis protein